MGTTIKGTLIAIGGAEDKGEENGKKKEARDVAFHSEGVLNAICELLPGREPVIEVITVASAAPQKSFENYQKAFRKLDVRAHHLKMESRDDAGSKTLLQRLEKCCGVMIAGGDQARLSSTIGGTAVLELLQERYRNDDFVIAGTSAGAACMSTVMMGGGSSEKGNIKGEVKLAVGLGFIGNVIIDTHFDTRARFARLAEAIANQPGIIGIGLGEDTGVIIEKGSNARAIGSDSVTIIDGSEIVYDNIADIREGLPITIAKLGVYLISRFDRFDLASRTFTPAPAADRERGEG
ncbi:MAG TPA: cyanophycinase [Flavisolibacter sp.]|nr:cyanophycinase [Flavisolibacter sp.]